MKCKYCGHIMEKHQFNQYDDTKFYCNYCGYSYVLCTGSGIPLDNTAPTKAFFILMDIKAKLKGWKDEM